MEYDIPMRFENAPPVRQAGPREDPGIILHISARFAARKVGDKEAYLLSMSRSGEEHRDAMQNAFTERYSDKIYAAVCLA